MTARTTICFCHTTLGGPYHPWEHSSSCPNFRPQPRRRVVFIVLLWIAGVVAFGALALMVLLTPVRRPAEEVAWERINETTERGCDAKGNLLYRHWRGGFAGTELIVVDGGCQ